MHTVKKLLRRDSRKEKQSYRSKAEQRKKRGERSEYLTEADLLAFRSTEHTHTHEHGAASYGSMYCTVVATIQ
jgi:hypothetical protein